MRISRWKVKKGGKFLLQVVSLFLVRQYLIIFWMDSVLDVEEVDSNKSYRGPCNGNVSKHPYSVRYGKRESQINETKQKTHRMQKMRGKIRTCIVRNHKKSACRSYGTCQKTVSGRERPQQTRTCLGAYNGTLAIGMLSCLGSWPECQTEIAW